MFNNDVWALITFSYVLLIVLTFIPVVRENRASVAKQSLTIDVNSLKSKKLSEEGLEIVKDNFSRIEGSLKFWKKQAAQNKRFHFYVMLWTTIAAPLIPILTQEIGDNTSPVRVLLTIVSVHSAIFLAFHRLLKPDKAFVSYRRAESGYYDLLRTILDRPHMMGGGIDETKNLDNYLERVNHLRENARNLEIAEYFPTMEGSVTAFTSSAQQAGINIQLPPESTPPPPAGTTPRAGTGGTAQG